MLSHLDAQCATHKTSFLPAANTMQKCLSTPIARSITTSASSRASITPITTSAADYTPVKPIEEQAVLATIHQFPSLEPLRFETYPANHLYLPTRRDILHRAVVYEGDSTRLGTASTKDRHEVRGSARKIRPQKGSGRARLGDKKSPMLRGGGVAFGPKPRNFATELPQKVYDLAWRTALSYRFRKGELIIVDNAMEIEAPSTRLLNDIFKYHEKVRGKGRNLMVTLEERPLLEDALEQMGRSGQALTWEEVDVKDLLELSRIMIERDALHNILLAHQEDLTHTTVQPWHKSFIRSSPPSELENIIGWSEFRELQRLQEIAPKDVEIARPTLYEEAADKRYTHASSLPNGAAKDELTVSAYTLLAEAKQLHFHRTTGLPWSSYIALDREFEPSNSDRFPRIQTLEYQRNIKLNLAASQASNSPLEAEALELEAAEMEIEQLVIKHEAAILAAQVWEHLAEAARLQDLEQQAEESLQLASDERVGVEDCEMQVLEKRVEVARMQGRVAALKNDYVGVRSAKKVEQELAAELEAKQSQMAAMGEMEGEMDEVAEAQVLEAEKK
jgi:large subunit ribosomal protein L4